VSRRNRASRSVDVAAVFGDCGKKRYPHKNAAEDAAQHQMQYAAARSEVLELRVYQCTNPFCKGWHLTEKRNF